MNNKVYMADATPEKTFIGLLQKKKGEDEVGYRLLIETAITSIARTSISTTTTTSSWTPTTA